MPEGTQISCTINTPFLITSGFSDAPAATVIGYARIYGGNIETRVDKLGQCSSGWVTGLGATCGAPLRVYIAMAYTIGNSASADWFGLNVSVQDMYDPAGRGACTAKW